MAAAGAIGGARPAAAQQAERVVRIGTTLAAMPHNTGAPDQGAEGIRWMGFTLYDSLVQWNLRQRERIPEIQPCLATEWTVNPADRSKWIFKLRQGVKFHDGSDFNADAVVFNIEKLTDDKAPHYDLTQRRNVGFRIPAIRRARKIDDHTVEIDTGEPNSQLLHQIVFVHMSSPAQWRRLGSWQAFAREPSGTGPFRLDRYIQRERAEIVRNPGYWDPQRMPKVDRIVFLAMPEVATRTAALLSGQIDWNEAPSADAVARMQRAGIRIEQNPYPHVWPYIFRLNAPPVNDVRVRQAMNLAINREEIVRVLGGWAVAARGHLLPSSPWFGNPGFRIGHDPDRARALLASAGFGPRNVPTVRILIAPSGSGQMQPLPMNELIQEHMRQVGINLEFDVVEWQALRTVRDKGPDDPASTNIHGINNSMGTFDPYSAFERFLKAERMPPRGLNYMGLRDAELDRWINELNVEFDEEKQNAVMRRIHEKMVDNAYWLWVVHDTNPRAIAARVRNVVAPQSWFIDLTTVEVA